MNIENPNVILRSSAGTELATNTAPVIMAPPSPLATYMAEARFAPAATPTDVFTISGAAGRVLRLKKLLFSMTQTTGAIRDVLLVKRSTLNTAGTFTSPARVPLDSAFAASVALVQAYTANPTTLGTIVGNVASAKLLVAAPTLETGVFVVDFSGEGRFSPLVLRSATELLAVNLNGVTSAGNLASVTCLWTEE